MAAPRSVGQTVFLGLPPTLNTLLVPPGVYGSMAAPRSVRPAVSGLIANPQHTFGPSWSVRLRGRSSQCETRGLLGLTANPQHLKRLDHQTSAVDVNLNQGFVLRPYPRWCNGHSRDQWIL